MFARSWLALCVTLMACGPEAGVDPRTGVYDAVYETVANDCPREFDNRPLMDAIVFADEALFVGFPAFPYPYPNEKAEGVWLQSYVHAKFQRDADGVFVRPESTTWYEGEGCRMRHNAAVELPADDVVLTRVTYEWESAGACAWLEALERCTLVRESTATLREACDGCEFAELVERIQVLWAEENPLPE